MIFRIPVVAAVLLCAGPLAAQEFRSTITGRVIDAQQAVVPGVKIVCTQVETGARYETVSGGEGSYTVPFLPPGEYTVEARASGFRTYLRKGVQVSTNERIQLDITLALGPVSESVTITADAPALETATASTGQVINSRQIENMPTNGRTPLVLAQLSSGVTPTGSPRFVRPFDNGGSSDFAMGGAPKATNELLLDGAPDVGTGGNVAYNPPVDAVMELKVESFQADAAYGHSGGGTVNVLLKSGTNSLHGAAYEFNQVSKLAATPFFLNRSGQQKNVTRYNQWGANAGGPVFVPKLFDGRNKLFFYFAYEGLRDGLPRPYTYTVPTDAQRGGDLSAALKAGPQYQIYDPLTGVKEGSRVRRQPLPNNIIPATRINPVAQALLPFYPAPNNPPMPDGGSNYVTNQLELNAYHNELARLDYNASERHKVYVNFRNNLRTNSKDTFHNIANLNQSHRDNWGGMLDDVLTLAPTAVWNTRVGYTRYVEDSSPGSAGYDITKLGFPKALAAASPLQKLPELDFDHIVSLADNGGSNAAYETYQIFSSLTKMAGTHSLKFGADLRLYRQSQSSYGNASAGLYSFGSQWTRGPLDNSPAAPLGQDLASFLLGLPTGGNFDLNGSRINQAGYYSLFVQDDFRIRPGLTLNLGLRYERDLPTTERYNRSVNGFDFTTPSPISAAAAAAYAKSPIPEIPASQFRTPGGLLFAGPGDRNVYDTRTHNFSPRVGFAWKPAALGNTVIRGGAGMFYFPLGTTGINQYGFSQSTSVVPTLDSYLTPNVTLSNPFPAGITPPLGSSQGIATYLGKSVNFYNPNPQNAYSVRWTFNIQRELPGKITSELGYEANHAVHLSNSHQLDFTPAQYYSTRPYRDQPTIDFLSAAVANPMAGLIPGTGLSGNTISRSSLLKPYPQFSGVQEDGLNEGNSYFHMLSLRVEKRFSAGLSLLANYQFSKMIARTSRLNDSDLQLDKRPAAEDRPQRVVISASYDLPFGRGKRIASQVPRAVNGVIGGWILNGIYQRQSGQVLGWGNIIYSGADIHLNPRGVDGAFDTTQFNRKSNEQLGSNIRTFPSAFANLRADGPNNFDLSAIKQFPIREKLNLQYRCEWFNAFNHAVFNGPSTSPTSAAFATINGVNNLSRVIQMGLRLTW